MFDDLVSTYDKIRKDYWDSLDTIEECRLKGAFKVGDVYRKIDEEMNKKGFGMIYEVIELNGIKAEILGKLVKIV